MPESKYFSLEGYTISATTQLSYHSEEVAINNTNKWVWLWVSRLYLLKKKNDGPYLADTCARVWLECL